MSNAIITIGRQYGSCGHEIGRLLAARLGVPIYDKQSLKQVVRDMGLEDAMNEAYAHKAGSFLYQLVMSYYSFGYYDTAGKESINQKAPTVAFDAVRKVAKQGPCVIVGRCADFVLRDWPNVTSVFVHAPLKFRIQRVAERLGLDAAQAEEKIRATDRLRKSYYNYYTDKNWGETDSYQLSIDGSALNLDKTATLLQDFVRMKEKQFTSAYNDVDMAI